MLKVKSYRMDSVSALIMHSGQMADPLNPHAKAMKKVSGKRAKTEADHEHMAEIEFKAGLYMGDDGPVLPPQNMRKMIIEAARKSREGKLAESGVFVTDNTRLEYDGPRDDDSLWEDKRFVSRELVTVSRARIARTRPIFHDWNGTVNITFDDEVVTEQQLDKWMDVAGAIIGLGDWRPLHGRFNVSSNGHQ